MPAPPLRYDLAANPDPAAQEPQELAVAPPPPPPPPPPPATPRPSQYWTIWGYLYILEIARRTVIANIFLASGPQYPEGGPPGVAMVQFWWPEGPPGEWHGEWNRDAHGPGTLWIWFNGYAPTRQLHGALLHGGLQRYDGYDYAGRRVEMRLFSAWAVNQRDELDEIFLPARCALP